MTDWIYNIIGIATIIYDNDCLRDNNGQVIAWVNGINVYSLNGDHIGWFEKGILYDSSNDILGFIKNRTGNLPSIPGIGGTPGTPGFAGRPGKSGFSGAPGRPGYGGWSSSDLNKYFE